MQACQHEFMKYWMLYFFNFWPPFLGAGIKIDYISPDLTYVRVRLKKRPWTANIIGIQYGGSIFSMTDPFFMTILLMKMGKGYRILDKSTTISYLKPGLTTLFAEFKIPEEQIAEIRAEVDQKGKLEKRFVATVTDTSGNKIAEVDKLIWFKKL